MNSNSAWSIEFVYSPIVCLYTIILLTGYQLVKQLQLILNNLKKYSK